MQELIGIETDRVRLHWTVAPGQEPAALSGRSPRPGHVEVRALRDGLRFVRGGDPAPVSPRLFEGIDYQLLLESLDGAAIELVTEDPRLLERLSPLAAGRALQGPVNFGTRVGRTVFEVRVDGEPEVEFEVEVFPTRLDYETDYRALLREVQEFFAALALEYLRSTYQLGSYQRVPRTTSLEWLTLLRHVGERLENALRHIAERPRRGLIREERFVRAERLRRVDSSLRRQLLRGAGAGRRLRLDDGLEVRRRLRARRAETTLNTPEHRWLRDQLEQIRRKTVELRDELEVGSPETAGLAVDAEEAGRELASLERRMSLALRLEPFAEAKGAAPSGFASLQLLHAPGYREAYRACLLLALGLRIHDGPLRLGVKELDTLYGYWCYVALLKLVSEETGQPVPPANFFAVRPRGLVVRLRKGRRSQAHFPMAGGRRVTVTYQPDLPAPRWCEESPPEMMISLGAPRWPGTHLLLDARYRVEAGAGYLERHGSPGPPEEELRRLHVWRDAVGERVTTRDGPEIQTAILKTAVAFPYRPARPADFRRTSLWRGHEQGGVGAVPLLPGSESWLAEWLGPNLGAAGWRLSSRAPIHRLRHAALRDARRAREPAAVLPPATALGRGHLAWLQEHGAFPLPLESGQALPWRLSWLVFWSRRDGKASRLWCSRVRGMRVAPWQELRPPWGPERSGSGLGLVAELGAWEPLPLSGSAQRTLAEEPWSDGALFTSRLALERARRPDELLLASRTDWRLFEALEAMGATPRVVRNGGRRIVHLADGSRAELDGPEGPRLLDARGRTLPPEALPEETPPRG